MKILVATDKPFAAVAELECRIIQTCDAFDSLISGMECKRICVQEAINQIKENDGGRYDNKIIKCLLSSIAKYPVGTTVKTKC